MVLFVYHCVIYTPPTSTETPHSLHYEETLGFYVHRNH